MPIVSPLHNMFGVSIGLIRRAPWVVDEKLVIRDVMSFSLTGDHRYGDGAIV